MVRDGKKMGGLTLRLTDTQAQNTNPNSASKDKDLSIKSKHVKIRNSKQRNQNRGSDTQKQGLPQTANTNPALQTLNKLHGLKWLLGKCKYNWTQMQTIKTQVIRTKEVLGCVGTWSPQQPCLSSLPRLLGNVV